MGLRADPKGGGCLSQDTGSVVRFLSPSGVAALGPRPLPPLILDASPSVDHYVTAEAVTDPPVPEVAPTHARE